MGVHVALFFVQVAFATGALVGRLAFSGQGHVDPTALAFVRAAAGAVAFHLARLLLRGSSTTLAKPNHKRLFVLSILGVVVNQAFFLHGLKRGSASSAALLSATIPVFTAAMGVALRKERATARTLVGIVVATSGVLLLTGLRDVSVGNLLVTINSLSYAAYLVAVGEDIRRDGALVTIAWVFTWGALILLPFGAPALLHNLPAWTARDVEIVLWFVAVPTIFAYLANAWALGRAKPSVVATYVYLQPLLVLLVAGRMLHEALSPKILLAAFAILAGVTIVVFKQKVGGPRERPTDDRQPTTDDRYQASKYR